MTYKSDKELFIEQNMVVCSSISLIFTFFTILSFLIFPDLSKKSYHKVVLFTTIGDFFMSIGGTLGLHNKRDVSCYIQWFLTNYFPLASVFWTLVIIYQLYKTIILTKPTKSFIHYHIICWSIPLIVTLLPLSTEHVGPFYEWDWCYLQAGNNIAVWSFWVIASFYFWIWLSTFFMIIIYIRIYLTLRKVNSEVVKKNSIKALKKLAFYPLIMTFCLIGVAYIDTHNALFEATSETSARKEKKSIAQFVSYGLPYLVGTFTSINFFLANSNTIFKSDVLTRLTDSLGAEIKNSVVVKKTVSEFEFRTTVSNPLKQTSSNPPIETISNPPKETISDSI